MKIIITTLTTTLTLIDKDGYHPFSEREIIEEALEEKRRKYNADKASP